MSDVRPIAVAGVRYNVNESGKMETMVGAWVRLEDYERLLAEVKKKDERIEELEIRCENAESGATMLHKICEVERLNAREITDEQIDKAWGLAHSDPDVEDGLAFLGIVECKGCGGSGDISIDGPVGVYWAYSCPRCHGHGWVRIAEHGRE